MQALTMCVCTLMTDLISPAADILFLRSLQRKNAWKAFEYMQSTHLSGRREERSRVTDMQVILF